MGSSSGGSSGTTVPWVDQTAQTSNGGATYVQHGNPIDVGAASKLAIFLHVINGPASGTTTIKVQESPNYGDDGVTDAAAAWIDLKSFSAVNLASTGTWQKMQIPDGTIYSFGQWIRIVATNSVAGQTCLFEVKLVGY
jgi:hypothetical protein